jgi:hypothetical protein
MAKSGTIKAQHTIALGEELYQPANAEVLNHRPVAVEKNHARASGISPLPIVHPDAVAFDEPPHRWVSSFCY